MLRFRWAGRSHVGLVRPENEDSGFAGPYALLVADGVGGAAAGEVASASTTYVISAYAMAAADTDVLSMLDLGVRTAHEQLRYGVAASPSRAGMATTLTTVVSDGSRFGLGHIGDSRGFVLRDGMLTQVTRDHTWVQMLVDDGRITRDEARVHPHRSVVLRSVNGDQRPEPELEWLDLAEGDRLLLCSDGLTDFVPADRITQLLALTDVEDAVDALVAAALRTGGRDNVTCVAADVISDRRVCGDGALLGAVRDLDNVLDPAAVRLPHPA